MGVVASAIIAGVATIGAAVTTGALNNKATKDANKQQMALYGEEKEAYKKQAAEEKRKRIWDERMAMRQLGQSERESRYKMKAEQRISNEAARKRIGSKIFELAATNKQFGNALDRIGQ